MFAKNAPAFASDVVAPSPGARVPSPPAAMTGMATANSSSVIASATETMVLEDSGGEEDPEERDTYFEVDARD